MRRTGETRLKADVCIVCSAGGHLTEALAATSQLATPRYFVTHDEPHVKASLESEEVYYVVDPHVSPLLYLKNMWQSLLIFLKKRPKIVITTGAGIAIATCLLVKLFGGTLIFVESGARVTAPSKTGRLLYRYADVFIVQWKPLLVHYPRAVYGGPLL